MTEFHQRCYMHFKHANYLNAVLKSLKTQGLTWVPRQQISRVLMHVIVGSMGQESSQQLQMWFSEHFLAPKLAGLFVTPIVSATVEQIWREKMSEKPHSIRLLR